MQNSWDTALGHSIRHFTGEFSRREEQQVCPNARSPYEWVPLDYEGEDKWKLRSPTVLRYFAEGSKPGHFHTKDWAVYAEVLSFTASNKGNYLNDSNYYAVYQVKQAVDETVRVSLAVSAEPDFSNCSEFVTLPPAPFDYLAFFFAPFNTTADNGENCGHYLIPYDFVELVSQSGGLWVADAMDVEFSDESYVHG